MELPPDILGEVIKYLLPHDQVSLSQVNIYLHHQLKDIPNTLDLMEKKYVLEELREVTTEIRRWLNKKKMDKYHYVRWTTEEIGYETLRMFVTMYRGHKRCRFRSYIPSQFWSFLPSKI